MWSSWQEAGFGGPGILEEEMWLFRQGNDSRFLSRWLLSCYCSCMFHPAPRGAMGRSCSQQQQREGGCQQLSKHLPNLGIIWARVQPHGPANPRVSSHLSMEEAGEAVCLESQGVIQNTCSHGNSVLLGSWILICQAMTESTVGWSGFHGQVWEPNHHVRKCAGSSVFT